MYIECTFVAARCSVSHSGRTGTSCSVLQRLACVSIGICCSVWQCVAVCCSVLQCVAYISDGHVGGDLPGKTLGFRVCV